MEASEIKEYEHPNACGTICLKYVLLVFNFIFWYCSLLLLVFLMEVIAGILSYLYRQQLSEELKSHMNKTIVESYGQPDQQRVTDAMDTLQQEFKCCGSHDWDDWQRSDWVKVAAAECRLVPDSCCKSPTTVAAVTIPPISTGVGASRSWK